MLAGIRIPGSSAASKHGGVTLSPRRFEEAEMRTTPVLLTMLLVAPCFGGGLDDTLSALAHPTLGADAVDLEDVSLCWGHATVKLTGDFEASVVAAGGAVGFAFEGGGRIEVTTENLILFASAVAKRDLRPWFERYVYGTDVPKVDGT